MEIDVTPKAQGLNEENVTPQGSVAESSPAPSSQKKESGKEKESRKLPDLTSKPKRLLFVIPLVVIALAAGIFGLSKLFGGAPKPVDASRVAAITVTVEPATMQPMQRQILVNGSVWAWDPLSIGAEVSGLKIEEVLVDEGHPVKRGQVLARLNASVLTAQLDQQKARLNAARASYSKSVQPNRPEDISAFKAALDQTEANVAQQEATLARARANLINAEENARRYSGLVKQGAVSAQDAQKYDTDAKTAEADLHNAQHGVQAAKSARDQAKERYAMAEVGGRKEDIDISRASVAEIQANIRQLAAQIEQTVIRAPADGTILKRDAHIGDITAAGKALFFMVRDNRLELRAQVPEVDLPRIKPGQPVDITDGAHANFNVKGVVREVSPMVDESTRLGTARIDLPRDCPFKPGNFVRGDINIGHDDVLAVPAKAVLDREDQSQVFTVTADNKVEARLVKTGARSSRFVEITSGLSAGDRVVVKGAGFLKDGDYVRVGQD